MTIVSTRSTVACDDCGDRFEVDHDLARSVPAGWAVYDVAVDAVRGGLVHGKSLFDGSCSVQHGRHLCIQCTRDADESEPEEQSA